MAKKIIITLIITTTVFLPGFSFGQNPSSYPEMPETFQEAEEIGEKALKELPGIIKGVWKNEVLPIWQRMWNWFRENIWLRIKNWLSPEIEKRKQYLKEGIEREKEEIKTEAPEVGKSLWEKFKDLIK